MNFQIDHNLLDKDPAAKDLIAILSNKEEELGLEDAYLYHEFPFYLGEEEEIITANVMIISKKVGLLLFKCSPETIADKKKLGNLSDEVDQIYGNVYSKLVKSKLLRKKRSELLVPITPFLFLPNLRVKNTENYHVFLNDLIMLNRDNLEEEIGKCKATGLLVSDDNILKETLSVLEGAKGISRPKERKYDDKKGETKGKILGKIESEIAVFDVEQKRAAMNICQEFQRIRGLAGSGKTIVLAMKAALIHIRYPDAEILYTFFTKSLYSFIKKLITRFYRQFADGDPNWEKIKILHAWGGRSLPGVYYNVCQDNDVAPKTFSETKGLGKHAFDHICKDLVNNDLKKMFDYSILDEGQDFPQYFYQLCRKITKKNRVIWGYDECQNILDVKIQDTKETFGRDKEGKAYVDFSKTQSKEYTDVVLHKCYRNPRKILVCAFALGLGIYNDIILQMLENNKHWEDLGFNVLEGESVVGDKMKVDRPKENSPLLQGQLFEDEDIIIMKVFDKFEQECKYVVDQIMDDLKQELLPEDILVISVDDVNARLYFSKIGETLHENGVGVFNILEAPSTTKTFVLDDCVTLTTVYRAKGNEAGRVYIVGVDSVFGLRYSIKQRNKIFTAVTRAKGWVTITGLGENAKICEKEINMAMEKYPYLEFKMPDPSELKIFQRDLDKNQEEFNKIQKGIEKLSKEMGLSKKEIMKQLETKKWNKKEGRAK